MNRLAQEPLSHQDENLITWSHIALPFYVSLSPILTSRSCPHQRNLRAYITTSSPSSDPPPQNPSHTRKPSPQPGVTRAYARSRTTRDKRPVQGFKLSVALVFSTPKSQSLAPSRRLSLEVRPSSVPGGALKVPDPRHSGLRAWMSSRARAAAWYDAVPETRG